MCQGGTESLADIPAQPHRDCDTSGNAWQYGQRMGASPVVWRGPGLEETTKEQGPTKRVEPCF
jgi:hypothetical protein